jgi:uncharacterized protein with von Willebrand factor type A (vWA) domain
MFINFFFTLREAGVPLSLNSFLTLQKALNYGLIENMSDLYITVRSILVKDERYFDLYDQVFSRYFKETALPGEEGLAADELTWQKLSQWLEFSKKTAEMLSESEADLEALSPDELLAYFKERLKDQKGEHHGGSKWIGTDGTSPVGASGYHPDGMRVLGEPELGSAMKVAAQRRYKDYSRHGALNQATIGEALKRLKHLVPAGAKDQLNINDTIYETVKNCGEIQLVFKQRLRNRLKIILAIDNGGWSMDSYVGIVQTLFNYARAQFDDLKTCYFHNTIYDTLWEDPARCKKPLLVDDFARLDPETRFIVVGDARMSPYELVTQDGSIHITNRTGEPSIERLKFIAETFRHCVWLNPISKNKWDSSLTITKIKQIFPMFELSLDGLEKAVCQLMTK